MARGGRGLPPLVGRAGGVLRENWRLKVLATAFAVVLWLFVVGERQSEIGLVVPIELRNIPGGTVITGDVEREVQVRVVGPQTLLAGLSPEDVRVAVDVSQVRPDRPKTVRLTTGVVEVPRGLQAVRVSPPEITVRVDSLARRRVPVEVALAGAPQAGLEVKGWRADPAEVYLVGGAQLVGRIRAVETERIDLSGVTRDVAREVALVAPPGGVRIDGPSAVRVQVRVGRVDS